MLSLEGGPDTPFTWSLVWFDHEEFDWDKMYLCDDGLLHGRGSESSPPAAHRNPEFPVEFPSASTLRPYFWGSLEAEFEQDEGIKPTYQWYLDTLKR